MFETRSLDTEFYHLKEETLKLTRKLQIRNMFALLPTRQYYTCGHHKLISKNDKPEGSVSFLETFISRDH